MEKRTNFNRSGDVSLRIYLYKLFSLLYNLCMRPSKGVYIKQLIYTGDTQYTRSYQAYFMNNLIKLLIRFLNLIISYGTLDKISSREDTIVSGRQRNLLNHNYPKKIIGRRYMSTNTSKSNNSLEILRELEKAY